MNVVPNNGDIAAALAKAMAQPPTVLLQRGSTYRLPRTVDIPRDGLVLAATGDAHLPRPVVVMAGNHAFNLQGKSTLKFQGIRLQGEQPGKANAGIRAVGCSNLAITDCIISGFTMGVTLEHCRTVTVAGNWILDNYGGSPGVRSSGLYADLTDGLTLSGNVFDCNGWRPGQQASFENHNVYLTGRCGAANVTGNIFSRGSNFGAQIRCGGNVSGNLFLFNVNHLSFGLVNGEGPVHAGGVVGTVTNNAFVGTGPTQGGAIQLGNILSASVTNNLIAHAPASVYAAITAAPCKLTAANQYVTSGAPEGKPIGIRDLTIAGNYVWDWSRLGPWSLQDTPRGKLSVQAAWGPPKPVDLRKVLGDSAIDEYRNGKRSASNIGVVIQQLRQAVGV